MLTIPGMSGVFINTNDLGMLIDHINSAGAIDDCEQGNCFNTIYFFFFFFFFLAYSDFNMIGIPFVHAGTCNIIFSKHLKIDFLPSSTRRLHYDTSKELEEEMTLVTASAL